MATSFYDADDYDDAGDAAYVEYQNSEYERWAAENADALAEEAYQQWALTRELDDEDSSREAYDAYIESMIPSD